MTEWNASEPDATRVYYDLAEWDFEQQAELAAALADAEIPHGWEGTELMVPEEFEAATDAVFADVEQRLEMMGKGVASSGDDASEDTGDESDGEPIEAAEFVDGEPVTEYDLAEWADLERALVADSLTAAGFTFRWEEHTLVVPTTSERDVEAVLDDVENGNVIPVIDDGPDGDELPFESLNSFFLAGERLRKNPRDADGLERLLEALKIADPNRPPSGLELRVWRRTCDLAERLADVLVDAGDDDGDDAADTVVAVATDLHDLLRPLI